MNRNGKGSRDPARVKDYNQKYYRENRDKINEAKRRRYKDDPEYRARVKARSKIQADSSAVSGKVKRSYNGELVYATKIGVVANNLDINPSTIIDWEYVGVIPPSVLGTARAYTDTQVHLIALAQVAVDEAGSLNEARLLVADKMKEQWMEGL